MWTIAAGSLRVGGDLASDEEREELERFGGHLDDDPFRVLNRRKGGVFLSEALLKIRGRNGRSLLLGPNRVQAEFERNRGPLNIVLKARQVGLSTWIAGRFFLKTITQPGTLTLEVAHTQEAAEDLFRMVHRFYAGLPAELRRGALRTSRENVRSLVFPKIDSEYRVETAGDPNAGRGLTVQNLHCTEVSRWPGDAAATLAGLRASLPPHGEVVLESTANGAYGCFYDEWMHASETGYVQHFFPWWWEGAYADSTPLVSAPDEEEAGLMDRHGLTKRQISFRRRQQKRFGKMMQQEYPESAETCFLASGSCVFDVETIDRRLAEVPEPESRRWNGELEIWHPPMAKRSYLVAIDPSGGGATGDYCAIQVIDTRTCMQCAEYRGRIGFLEIAEHAVKLAKEYGNALLVVERNNHGHAVLVHLEHQFAYANLFREGGKAGMLTTLSSRPQMVKAVSQMLIEHPTLLSSRRLLRECRTFVRDATGRPGAAPGEHDDCVMAYALAVLCAQT